MSSERDVEPVIRRGQAHAALVIVPGYQADLARHRPARVPLIVDGSDPQVVSAALSGGALLQR